MQQLPKVLNVKYFTLSAILLVSSTFYGVYMQ